MQEWLAGLLVAVATRLGSWLLAQVMIWLESQKQGQAADASIDARLKAFKDAYQKAFDGTAATAEQKLALRKAISDFIHNPGGSGL